MAIIKKNIWSLFYILLVLMLIGFTLLLINVYSVTKHEVIMEQESITKLKAKSVKSIFSEYEVVLDIVGNHLSLNQMYDDVDLSRKILDETLRPNSNILAYAMVKPNGDVYVTSSNVATHRKQFKNLYDKVETKAAFEQTIKSKMMVLGRTYYLDALQRYILPVRKAFYDSKGELEFVMVAIIDPFNIFDFKVEEKYHHILFREVDYFYQVFLQRDVSEVQHYYDKPLPKELVDGLKQEVVNRYKLPIEKVMEDEMVVTVKGKNYLDLGMDYVTGQYIKRYGLWTLTQVPVAIVEHTFMKKASYLVALQLVVFLILYFLVKTISASEQKKKKALEYQAHHDYLTGLHNRLFLVKNFDSNIHKPYSLFFIDMDNFKSINDSYGHEYGDLLLKEISSRLLALKNKEDYLVRYSGDEFLLILFDLDSEVVSQRAQAILDTLNEAFDIDPYRFHIGSSIGIAQYPLNGSNIEEVKRFADIAMYESKKEKNKYTIFEDTIKNKYLRRMDIEHELKNALENNEIYMMYQPQVNAEGKLYGVEALVRWENEKLGFIPPDQFIEIAEAMGYMTKLGDFITQQSLNEIAQLQSELKTGFQLSINISVKQFMEKEFFDKIQHSIQESGLQKVKLTLEVTENVCIDDMDYVIELLEKFRDYSIKISLDDFGTGYSSLSMLKRLPIDELKIDKSFVDDILTDRGSKMMVKNIINIGTNLDLTVLAEGIEELEQKELLDAYGCSLFQGYYYSKPLKLNDLKTYIENEQKRS